MSPSPHSANPHPTHASPPNEVKTRQSRPIQSDMLTEPTILLVDDDPAVLLGLARVLRSEGWQVVTAADGEEALARLAERQPDLMITDLSMAEVSGWDLLFHENMQRPTLPIFVITALPPSSIAGADRLASEFFQKPLDLELLVTAVRRRLEGKPSKPSKAPAVTTQPSPRP